MEAYQWLQNMTIMQCVHDWKSLQLIAANQIAYGAPSRTILRATEGYLCTSDGDFETRVFPGLSYPEMCNFLNGKINFTLFLESSYRSNDQLLNEDPAPD